MDNKEKAKLIIAYAKEDLLTFAQAVDSSYVPNWHHEIMAEKLMAVERGEIQRLMIFIPPRHGKLIADSTPILTEKGWKTHGELCVGDMIFGEEGNLVRVEAVSEKQDTDYVIEFSDGAIFHTHGNHEWKIFNRNKKRYEIKETKELTELSCEGKKGKRGHRYAYQVDENKTVHFGEKTLKVHPYFLGVWLGDGKTSDVSFCGDKNDVAILNKIERLGYKKTWDATHKTTGVKYYGFSGLRNEFREVIGNKHIPDEYKFSSLEQRLELLAGLIDTDGSKDKRDRYRFSTCNERLANDVKELVTTLGSRAYIMEYEPVVSTSGIIGRRKVYQVGFNL
jgi:hypothetical protein